MFSCEKCGMCCRVVGKNEMYKHLDRGDGCCIYFNSYTNECNIYKERPLLCRIDDMYKFVFYDKYSLEEYYHLNKISCFKLRRQRGEIYMDKDEIKNILSKRLSEICKEGIIIGSGTMHTLYDDWLPSNVASNAKEKICKGRVSSSDIIGVLDSSMSSKGKSGFAFTVDALFCSCFENTDSNFSIKYEDIDFVYYDNSDDDNIFLEIHRKNSDSFYKINHPWFSKKKIKWFLDEAKEMYDKANDDELDWDKL